MLTVGFFLVLELSVGLNWESAQAIVAIIGLLGLLSRIGGRVGERNDRDLLFFGMTLLR